METTGTDTSAEPIGSHIATRISQLQKTIPSADRRRTARGRMRTCKELTEHKRRAEQLRQVAQTETELAAVEALVREIDEVRSLLSQGGGLVRAVFDERKTRKRKQSPEPVDATPHVILFGALHDGG